MFERLSLLDFIMSILHHYFGMQTHPVGVPLILMKEKIGSYLLLTVPKGQLIHHFGPIDRSGYEFTHIVLLYDILFEHKRQTFKTYIREP